MKNNETVTLLTLPDGEMHAGMDHDWIFLWKKIQKTVLTR